MKNRYGFISNSSSTSFVCVSTVENHQKACVGLTPDELKIINAVVTIKRFGTQEVAIFDYQQSGGYYDFGSKSKELEGLIHDQSGLVLDDIKGVLWKYQEAIKKDKDAIYASEYNY